MSSKLRNSRILITGSSGLVGNSILRILQKRNYKSLFYPTRSELDLNNKTRVIKYIKEIKPDYVFTPAAFVGGIEANMKNPIDFLTKNGVNVIGIARSIEGLKTTAKIVENNQGEFSFLEFE